MAEARISPRVLKELMTAIKTGKKKIKAISAVTMVIPMPLQRFPTLTDISLPPFCLGTNT